MQYDIFANRYSNFLGHTFPISELYPYEFSSCRYRHCQILQIMFEVFQGHTFMFNRNNYIRDSYVND